jgi:hypothetical protein
VAAVAGPVALQGQLAMPDQDDPVHVVELPAPEYGVQLITNVGGKPHLYWGGRFATLPIMTMQYLLS